MMLTMLSSSFSAGIAIRSFTESPVRAAATNPPAFRPPTQKSGARRRSGRTTHCPATSPGVVRSDSIVREILRRTRVRPHRRGHCKTQGSRDAFPFVHFRVRSPGYGDGQTGKHGEVRKIHKIQERHGG